jgi:Tfp pilus assembly pilus retraction ATPase PilT
VASTRFLLASEHSGATFIYHLIGKLKRLSASLMQTGKNIGMQTLDDATQDLLTKKRFSP